MILGISQLNGQFLQAETSEGQENHQPGQPQESVFHSFSSTGPVVAIAAGWCHRCLGSLLWVGRIGAAFLDRGHALQGIQSVFHSPHAVPAHGSRGELQLASLRCQLQLHCSGCPFVKGDPSCHGFCSLHGAVLSPQSQFWKACNGRFSRPVLA